MYKTSTLFLAVLLLALTVGCAAKQTYRVPPRIDLTQHEMIGVIEINSSSEGELGPLATRRFTDEARRDQGVLGCACLTWANCSSARRCACCNCEPVTFSDFCCSASGRINSREP